MSRIITGSILFLLLLSGCQSATDTTKETPTSESQDRVQAVVLTQTAAYDDTRKAEVYGAYQSHTSLNVPNALGPQNKWFMFEGPVLENDLIAYRYYADSRHRFDIYGKTVTELVMDTVSWQYHDIMDWGSDILKVGNSLGIGSPAIYYQDSLYTLSDYAHKQIEVVRDDSASALIRTTFDSLRVGPAVFDLVQDWELSAGEVWSEISLRTSQPLPEGMHFATGIVKHLADIQTGNVNGNFYAWNWGTQSYHEEKMGMAITASQSYQPEAIEDEWTHVYVFRQALQEVNYRFLAAWERDVNKVQNEGDFAQLVQAAAQAE